jgi:hypothetical protein
MSAPSWVKPHGFDEDAPFYDVDDPVTMSMFVSTKPNDAAARNRVAPFREGPIETMYGIFSWDRDNLQTMDKLSRALTDACPPDVDASGRVGPSGVRSNFYGLRHVPGAPMDPATFPPVDNRKKRSDAGLADRPISQQHEWVFRSVVRLFFSNLENKGLRIARDTSMGSPFFLKSMTAKLDTARSAMKEGQFAGRLFLDGKYRDAYVSFQMGGCYYVVYREQMSDGVTLDKGAWIEKKRMVATFDYAISGGKRGELIQASKDVSNLVDSDGEHVWTPEGFFRTRRRTAMACPFKLNACVMVIAQAVRSMVYDVYAYTTHHTTRAQKQEKVSKWDFAIAADVSDHDTFWPGWLLDLICDELLVMGYADWWVEILRTTMRLPVYISAPSRTQGHVLMGDPFDPRLNVGLASGIGITDIMGSLLMIPCYALIQLDHTAPHLWKRMTSYPAVCTFMHSYMQGLEEIRQMSKSDDAFLGWMAGPSAHEGRLLQASMEKGDVHKGQPISPYMKISYENGGAFLGDVLIYDHTKSLSSARFEGNVISYVVNQFAPEFGVESHKPDRTKRARSYPGLAVEAAPVVFGSAPTYGIVNDIIEKVHYDTYGRSYRKYRNEQLELDKRALAKWLDSQSSFSHLGALSVADHEVIAEPNKMWWKHPPETLNPAVVEMVSSGLPPSETALFFHSVTKDVI